MWLCSGVGSEKVLRRLASQVDEKRHPRTNATVNQLLDKHFELLTLEQSTLATYVGYSKAGSSSPPPPSRHRSTISRLPDHRLPALGSGDSDRPPGNNDLFRG